MKKSAVAALALVAPAAFAASASYGSSAAFTTLEYRVIDLDPNDGIEASVTFDPWLSGSLAEALLHNVAESRNDSRVQFARAPGTAEASLGGASAMVSGGPSFMAIASGSAYNGGHYNAYEARARGGMNLVLAANTAVSWMVSYSLAAWATPSRGTTVYDSSTAALTFGDLRQQIYAFANPELGLDRTTTTGTFVHSLRNDSGVSSNQHLEVFLAATGGQVAPIPEPSSWLMGLAGLGALGVIVRRRSPTRPRAPGLPS